MYSQEHIKHWHFGLWTWHLNLKCQVYRACARINPRDILKAFNSMEMKNTVDIHYMYILRFFRISISFFCWIIALYLTCVLNKYINDGVFFSVQRSQNHMPWKTEAYNCVHHGTLINKLQRGWPWPWPRGAIGPKMFHVKDTRSPSLQLARASLKGYRVNIWF